MREIRSSVEMGKPLLALLEPDAAKGLSMCEIKFQLTEGWRDDRHVLHSVADSYAKWGFDDKPAPDELVAALFQSEPIEWNRLGKFQVEYCRGTPSLAWPPVGY
jgi:hypothetical protein